MKYQQLGHSSLRVSAISFGCMSLGTDEKVNTALLHEAIDAGINLFDTADIYQQGQNEVTVGKALQGKRDKVYIATKVGNQPRQDGNGWDWNPRKAYILSAVEQSLQRLQTDHIDLYQLHGGTVEDNIAETIEAFEQLKQQGKIRFYGISSIRPNVIRQYVEQSAMSSVMMQYSLLDRRPEETCLPLLEEHHIGVLARGSVAKGLLINKPAAPYLNYTEAEVARAAQAAAALTQGARNATQTTLQFVLQHPAITTAVVGIRTKEQLQEAVQAMDAPMLTQEELSALKQVLQPALYEQHR